MHLSISAYVYIAILKYYLLHIILLTLQQCYIESIFVLFWINNTSMRNSYGKGRLNGRRIYIFLVLVKGYCIGDIMVMINVAVNHVKSGEETSTSAMCWLTAVVSIRLSSQSKYVPALLWSFAASQSTGLFPYRHIRGSFSWATSQISTRTRPLIDESVLPPVRQLCWNNHEAVQCQYGLVSH